MTIQNPYRFNTGGGLQPNTFIGGVAASIPDAATLASKLNISVSNITAFQVLANDIAARIEVNYSLPDALNDTFFWRANNNLTHYRDEGGKVTSIGQQVFRYSNNMTEAYFPQATSIGSGAFIQNGVLYDVIYIPRATTLGTSVSGDETVLFGVSSKTSIYLDPSLQTANAGSEEGDVAAARSKGANIVYVQNFTAPNAIGDFSIGTKYATSLEVNFTVPSSTNTINYYQVYNGFNLLAIIDNPGEYVLNLEAGTFYSELKVYAVDQYYNKSVSNIVSTTTKDNSIQAGYETETSAYKTRVETDGGIVIDVPYTDAVYKAVKTQSNYANVRTWLSYMGGVKKDVSDNIEKLYDLSGNNYDALYDASGTKPIYSEGVLYNATDNILKVAGSKLLGLTGFTLISCAKGTGLNSIHRYQGFNGSTGYIAAPYYNAQYTPNHGFIMSEAAPVTVADEPEFGLKANIDNNKKHIFTSKFIGGQGLYTYLDKTLTDSKTTTQASVTSNSDLTVGAYTDNGIKNVMKGTLYHLVTITVNLSDAHRQELENLMI